MGQVMKEIGELLYASRESTGLELDEVACQLKVGRAYLAALEQGDVSQLPEEVYVLGYLRGYARILGLDSEEIIKRFKQDQDIFAIKPNFVFPEEKLQYSNQNIKSSRSLPMPMIILVSFLMLVALAGIWYQGNIMNKLPNLPFSIMQLGQTLEQNTDTSKKI